jgi:filamentous hemagglutinin
VRIDLDVGERRNIAIAELILAPARAETLVGISGAAQRPGTVDPPVTALFTPTVAGGFARELDAEYKVLEEVARRLGTASETAPGTVRLLSERALCASCDAVLAQFKVRYLPCRCT